MRRDLNTCSSQSAMHHGVRVRVFFRRSSEHHSRNDSSSSTSWSHDVHVFSDSHISVVPGTFLRVLYNIHHHVAFARVEGKKKNTEQDQPAVRSAVAGAGAAAAAEAAAAESSSSSSSTTTTSRKAEAAEDTESRSEHIRMYTAVRDFSI